MRTTTLILNSIVVLFFCGFLAYTFIARQHLDSLARDFVTEKTLEYSKPVVAAAEVALDSPIAKKLLTDQETTAIRSEIAAYQKQPGSYISDLTRQSAQDIPMANKNPMVEKVAAIKTKIRTFYDNTLNALITDLRIFSVSNLVAGLIAFGLAYLSSSEIHRPIVWFSFLMSASVLFCTYLYMDGLTFFRILFRTHLGWWYAAFLCVVIVAFYLAYGRTKGTAKLEVDGLD